MTQSAIIESAFDCLPQVIMEVFAEYSFREATLREICSRANVNMVLESYSFRSKEARYTPALAYAFREANRLYPQDVILDKNSPPEQRLTLFINNFLHKLLVDRHLDLCSKLIAREIANPTDALDEIFETTIIPQFALLAEIIHQILGDSARKVVVQRCLLSIFGQPDV